MKRLYYYSKSKVQFIEIKDYKKKFALYISTAVIVCTSVLFGGYQLISSIISPEKSISELKSENRILKEKLSEVISLYSNINNELDSLAKVNNDLRIASNLPPLSDDERMLGVGGGYFDNSVDFLKNPSELNLKDALNFVDEISRKLEFEKSQYVEISHKIKQNEKLYNSIPAIKPSAGTLAYHGFGMRKHPILNVRKMHEGIDIITDIGTPVHASGDGKIAFAGYRGGYGLTIEIDHGFGYRTLYAHLSSISVREGKTVKRGELIAKTGNSGLSSGPHLHYEISHEGIKQDPSHFFFDNYNFFNNN